MAKILYPQVITEDLDDLKELEKYKKFAARNSHLADAPHLVCIVGCRLHMRAEA